MGGTYEGDEKCIQNCDRQFVKGRNHLGYYDICNEDNIKMNLKLLGCKAVDWNKLARDIFK
jgi:hypothetical protein